MVHFGKVIDSSQSAKNSKGIRITIILQWGQPITSTFVLYLGHHHPTGGAQAPQGEAGQEEGDQSRAGEEAGATEEGRGGAAQVLNINIIFEHCLNIVWHCAQGTFWANINVTPRKEEAEKKAKEAEEKRKRLEASTAG